jgi:AcrR family transcriptional regulator
VGRPTVEAERRDQILSAACDVIAEIGFKSFRVADVAKRVGMSTGIIHYYFETKRDLAHAAFEYNFERSLARRTPLLDKPQGARDRLHAFVESYLPAEHDTVKAWRIWAELWVEALHDPDLQELNERVYGEWRRFVAAIIRDGQDAGEFIEADPVLEANMLIAMIDGLALQALLNSRSLTLARMRQVCDHQLRRLEAGASD